jgi:arginine:pyruvate transaminase
MAPDTASVDSHSDLRFSPLVERIGGAGSRAWDIHYRARQLVDQGREDVIILSVGDPDFDTPPPIVDAVVESLRQGRTHYNAMEGILPLREAIAARHFQLTGQRVDAGAVVVSAGGQCALYCVIMCLAGPGDEIISPEPMYVTYHAVAGASGATLVQVPLKGDNNFHLNPDDVAAAITPRSRVLLVNFPHNPTGAVMTEDEMAGIAEIAIRHNLWVVSDEVYATLNYGGPHRSLVSLPGMAERTVVIDSLSKSHAMTGWRLGWSVSPGELPHHLNNLAQCLLYGCPTFIQDAAVVALSREFDEIAVMRQAFRDRRDRVAELVNQVPHVHCLRPEGSMFLMIDVRDSGLTSIDFAERWLEAEGVCALPCDGFGPSGAGFLRISLSAPLETLEEACARLDRFARGLNR